MLLILFLFNSNLMVKTNLALYNNSWYKPGDKWKMFLWYFINILIFKSSFIPINSIKISMLKLFGAKIGNNVLIKPNVNIKYPWNLHIGNNVWIGEEVWIDNLAKVVIGNNVCISQGSMLLCGNHDYKKEAFDLILGEISLEDGCWIGAKSVVCPGVVVRTHAILTVQSVATKELEEYSIYQGNPAVQIRKRIKSLQIDT